MNTVMVEGTGRGGGGVGVGVVSAIKKTDRGLVVLKKRRVYRKASEICYCRRMQLACKGKIAIKRDRFHLL